MSHVDIVSTIGIIAVIENGRQIGKYVADDMQMKKCYACIVQKWAWHKKPFPQLEKADSGNGFFHCQKTKKEVLA